MDDRLAVIGDVHGDAAKLSAMLHRLKREPRRLVFVGDYVNRGSDSRAVVDLLCDLRRERGRSCTFLLGNHEVELLRYIQTGDFARFASVGGIATIRSYTGQVHGDVHAQFLRAFPPQHADFIAQLETHYEQPGLFVSHAGYDPHSPTSRAVDALTSQSHPELFRGGAQPDVLTVCGHYAQSSRVPFADDRFVCVDTGCGTAGGPLTALLLPERTFITVD